MVDLTNWVDDDDDHDISRDLTVWFCAPKKAIADNFEAGCRPVRPHCWLYK
jgi:hypothetical protein